MIDHISLPVTHYAQSKEFYLTALKPLGYKLIGKPGMRTQYAPNYYAAFIIDPDGHNVEVVCRKKP